MQIYVAANTWLGKKGRDWVGEQGGECRTVVIAEFLHKLILITF